MNIGLLGFGVVGRGVYDMLAGRDDIRAAWVLCRRDLGELTARTTYEMQDILDDPAVDTVVEVMGGLHPAYEYVAAALRAGTTTNSPRSPKSTTQRCGARRRSAAASRG